MLTPAWIPLIAIAFPTAAKAIKARPHSLWSPGEGMFISRQLDAQQIARTRTKSHVLRPGSLLLFELSYSLQASCFPWLPVTRLQQLKMQDRASAVHHVPSPCILTDPKTEVATEMCHTFLTNKRPGTCVSSYYTLHDPVTSFVYSKSGQVECYTEKTSRNMASQHFEEGNDVDV